MSATLQTQIIRLGETRNIEQLKKLIQTTDIKTVTAGLSAKLGRSDCPTYWNYLLLTFDASDYESREKRFQCVKTLLDGLLKIELSYQQTYDLITRLCQDLNTFPSAQLVEIIEICFDGLRLGDPKCVSWKDLLPEVLKVLSVLPQLNVNGVSMTGVDYRNATVRNLYTMRWPTEVVIAIADMFKELNINSNELANVLNKFASTLQSLAPAELPGLSYQLFSMCATASQIIVPILAYEKYFYRFYYKKLIADLNSNTTEFDSIDAFSDMQMREAEETVLHHLNYCTQYKISEAQMCAVLRNFIAMPDVILTPFLLSAILTMTAANREPTKRLASSILLPFLRSVIKHNEDERNLAAYSVWCRDCLQHKHVNLAETFTVLIDQNKDGNDVITPGLVNLAFVLLKAKNARTLNTLAIDFLTKFIRKRFVFGQGIVKKLAEWMIVEQEHYQYAECLTQLSVADTFTVSECVKTINYVLDFFIWLPGEQAMRMMSFILPILKISALVRDAFIEILRKAIHSSNVKTRRMAVYGFCMILKQLNNSNSQRSQLGVSSFCTQQSISGFSLMSQATLGTRSNPQRHFDMLTLEIIGLLRNCFNQTLEIKCTLYEQLQRAVELNPKLVPHVLQFVDYHFRQYFDLPMPDDTAAALVDEQQQAGTIKFELIVQTKAANDNAIEVHDQLGRLILFVSHCLVLFDKYIGGDYDTREMERLLRASTEQLLAKELKFEEVTGPLTHYKSELLAQQLNFIEGLMAYALLTALQTNEHVKQLLPLFRAHLKLNEHFKALANATKKSTKKLKPANDTDASINGVPVKKPNTQLNNIWDLVVVDRFLHLLLDDVVPFAAAQHTTALRANVELLQYVLSVTACKIEGMRLEPEYKQLTHSRRMLQQLTDITKVLYERCIKRLPELWQDFDVKCAALAAECFQQCLQTANAVYKKKFSDFFVKGFDFHHVYQCKEAPAIIHDIIDAFMEEDAAATQANEALSKQLDGRKIPQALLHCLEVFYDNIPYGNRITSESYTWLMNFCKQNVVHTRELTLVHKLLFTQRQKTHSGAFFNTIAIHLRKVLGTVQDDADFDVTHTKKHHKQNATPPTLAFELKSITLDCADSCLNYLYAALRKQIDDVEYFVIKANNLCYQYRIASEEDHDMCIASLRSLERAICSQLVHITNALLILTNICIPLGANMDSLLKLLMQHYICLKNLAKHFLTCCSFVPVSIQTTKFDLLLQCIGKPLPRNIYTLITYIEANILGDQPERKCNPQAQKAKVLRETKLIPKIILCIENFNKHVILLSKRSNDRLADYLHFGTVRDFSIKTSKLKEAIDRTLTHSSQIELVPSELDADSDAQHASEQALLAQMEADSIDLNATPATDDDNNNCSISTTHSVEKKRRTAAKHFVDDEDEEDDEQLPTPEDISILENESNVESNSQLIKNVAAINKKSRKRTLRETENQDPDVISAVPAQQPKKRRGRPVKK